MTSDHYYIYVFFHNNYSVEDTMCQFASVEIFTSETKKCLVKQKKIYFRKKQRYLNILNIKHQEIILCTLNHVNKTGK